MSAPTKAIEEAYARIADAADHRAAGWEVLALAFYEPTSDWVAALASGQVVSSLEVATSWLGHEGADRFGPQLRALDAAVRARAAEDREVLLHELRVEYTGLFVGPGRVPAPPYESVYRDIDESSGRPVVHGPSTDAVEAAYRREGVAPASSHHDLPDHIATELEFLCYLCRKEAAAWRAHDADAGGKLRSAQQAFLADHLGRWVPSFCDGVAAVTPRGVYGAIGSVLREYLAMELGTGYSDQLRTVFPDRTTEPAPVAT